MNGVRSIFRRKGYLLTALAAAVLLAASSGTAYAQGVTIGFVGTSGEISEKAHLNPNSLDEPQMITVRVRGLPDGNDREMKIEETLGALSITASEDARLVFVNSDGVWVTADGATAPEVGGIDLAAGTPTAVSLEEVRDAWFTHENDLNLIVAQSPVGGGAPGAPDDNWLSEMIEFKLEVSGTASVAPDVYTLTVKETDVAPVAKFLQPSFALSEQSERTVQLDIAGAPGKRVPPGAFVDGASPEYTGVDAVVSVRVSNHTVVFLPGDIPTAQLDSRRCPLRSSSSYNKKLFYISMEPTRPVADTPAAAEWAASGTFANTGVLQTIEVTNIAALSRSNAAAQGLAGSEGTADFVIVGCGDGTGIADPRITLTILPSNLSELDPLHGDITIGPPLVISTDSNEAAPTLSFSPTDVTVDEGGSISTVLLAEGKNTSDVKMVKLAVEGDAMVSLMQDGEMLEEMDGYVYVDLGGNSSVRLTAMSHMDPDLMDGDTKFKAWKLMEGSAEGVNIGEGYWFRVDVVGMTAVPALPLLGQLLLALFLMAGGARRYLRRQG